MLTVADGALARLGRYSPRRRRPVHVFHGRGALVAPDGTVLWRDEEWRPNLLCDEGELSIIDVYLRAQANPSKYLMLADDTVNETDSITNVTESETPGADGYARQQIASGDWGAAALASGDYESVASAKVFGPNAGSAWSVQAVGICTVSTGTAGLLLGAISTTPLSIPTAISFQWTTRWKLR